MSPRWLIAAMALACLATTGAAPATDWLHASAQPDQATVPQGGSFSVAVTIEIDPGYHVNANRRHRRT